jgi:hypothetical protein
MVRQGFTYGSQLGKCPERRHRGEEVQWGDDHFRDGRAWPIRGGAISPGKTSSSTSKKELDQSASFR